MAIWVLAIELMLCALVGVQFWFALFGRVKNRALYLGLGLLFLVLKFAGAMPFVGAGLYGHGEALERDVTSAALAYFGAIAAGALIILVWGARTDSSGRLAAGTWRVGRALLRCVVVAVVLLGTVAVLNWHATRHLAHVQEDVVRRYMELTGPVPAKESNAASRYMEGFSLVKQVETCYEGQQPNARNGRLVEPMRSVPLILSDPDWSKAETTELAERLAPACVLFEKATALPSCRFEESYEVPRALESRAELTDLRHAAYAVCLLARSDARDGNLAGAFRRLETLGRMRQHLFNCGPDIMAALVDHGAHAMATRTTLDLLPNVKHEDELPKTTACMARADWQRALVGQELETAQLILDMADGKSIGRGIVTNLGMLAVVYRVTYAESDIEAVKRYFEGCREIERGGKSDYVTASVHHGKFNGGSPCCRCCWEGRAEDSSPGTERTGRSSRLRLP